MFRNKSVSTHQFAMVPKADIPRSSFRIEKSHKTTFDAGFLTPIYVDEVLPGDSFNVKMTAFARLATPIFPIMDNMVMESFFFFVPNRLVWANWVKFMGEQNSPGDSTSFIIPQLVSPAGGYAALTIYDYMGLPCVGQVAAGLTYSHSALPLRCYNLIFNEWFRDQNLVSWVGPTAFDGDGPDIVASYNLLRRGKRHDYFTACLPFTQKGPSVQLPLGTSAPIRTLATGVSVTGTQAPMEMRLATGGTIPGPGPIGLSSTQGQANLGIGTYTALSPLYPANLIADLSVATASTINQIRQSFQIQKLLERDARGGTRYIELVKSHFGVISPDARQQRPEYLGGGTSAVNISEIEQNTASGVTGSATPLGTLAAKGRLLAQGHGFKYSATEHGHIIGLVVVRADLTYQQGLRRMWSRSTRYDFYFPVFAALGEQAVLNKEIYLRGDPNDNLVFGYQERWAEYRYNPSMITGLFKSTHPTPLDAWHLAQRFTTLPTLNSTFIQDTPPVSRVVAVGAAANGQQFLFDSFFEIKVARPMPMYSVPGLVDHF